MKLSIATHAEQAKQDRAYWRARTPEERLDEVERLRLEAGIHPDFEDLLRLLEEYGVEYMIVI